MFVGKSKLIFLRRIKLKCLNNNRFSCLVFVLITTEMSLVDFHFLANDGRQIYVFRIDDVTTPCTSFNVIKQYFSKIFGLVFADALK